MKTQGERLAYLLKSIPHTYAEMQSYCISTSPQKRLREWEARNQEWKIVRGRRLVWGDDKMVYRTTWAVKRRKPAP